MTTVSWFAPGRVNLIGEHTDYNAGLGLPIAIRFGCRATVSPRAGTDIALSSRQEGRLEVPLSQVQPAQSRAQKWGAYPLGVLWALSNEGFLPQLPALQIEVDADVPAGAGLSSSAALECSTAAAINDLLGLGLSRQQLVTVTRRAENDYVGLPNGGLDQMASLLCEPETALLCDFATDVASPVPLDLAGANAALLVVNTNAPHRLADSDYAHRRASCRRAAERLGVSTLREVTNDRLAEALSRLADDADCRTVRHVVTENARVAETVRLLQNGDVLAIGPLLNASHNSLRDDYQVTVAQLDLAQESLVAAGAEGARMTGGGFGGCVIGLMSEGLVPTAGAAVTAAFAARGFAAPDWFTVHPTGGAHRD